MHYHAQLVMTEAFFLGVRHKHQHQTKKATSERQSCSIYEEKFDLDQYVWHGGRILTTDYEIISNFVFDFFLFKFICIESPRNSKIIFMFGIRDKIFLPVGRFLPFSQPKVACGTSVPDIGT